MPHIEIHRSSRTGWLRAAVMGANDGIVSTASLVLGIASAGSTHENTVLAGVAGLVAGAMSMAAGEYVAVCSQLDTEKADLEIEQRSIENNYDKELVELANIYEQRGLSGELAADVAEQLMEHDALGAHARDDIGLSEVLSANPIQAAFSSASAFALGALIPLLATLWSPQHYLIPVVATCSLLTLVMLGAIAARAGGAPIKKGAIRVVFWGALAMGLTVIVGELFNVMT